MTLKELYDRALAAPEDGTLTLILPTKRPKGFPRGELLCQSDMGKVYAVSAAKILKWFRANFDMPLPSEDV